MQESRTSVFQTQSSRTRHSFVQITERILFTFLMGGSALLSSNKALGLIDGQILAGKRWYSFELGEGSPLKVSATSIDVAAHVDPIPLIPIAIGVGLSSITPSSDEFGGTTTTMMQVGLDIQAWIPLIPVITPYVRLRNPFLGEFKVTGQDLGGGNTAEGTYKLVGPEAQAGIKLSLIPLVKLLIQVGKSLDTLEISDYKVNGVKKDPPTIGKTSGMSAHLGLEVGF